MQLFQINLKKLHQTPITRATNNKKSYFIFFREKLARKYLKLHPTKKN